MEYENYVKIIDVNEDVFEDRFNAITGNEFFIVYDIINIARDMGREIIDELDKKEIMVVVGHDDELGVDIEDFTEDFKDELLIKIEEEITNELRNKICEELLEYIGNNL